jgi:hypothetical protein
MMMEIGMLWFDDNPKMDFSAKVQKAADYYQHKFGVAANLCFVHPGMLVQQTATVGRIEVKPDRQVRPDHFYIGRKAAA